MNFDFWMRAPTILIFIILRLYWYSGNQKALVNKQKSPNKLMFLEKISMMLAACFILINVLGFTILRFESPVRQLIGLILVVFGCAEAIMGRYSLGINWIESYNYQIKKEHELITKGIYKYVRHPIYGGLMIGITGVFLVAKTYLFIPIFFIQIIIMTYFARREEKLLTNHFEREYVEYKKRTKMFIPFIY